MPEEGTGQTTETAGTDTSNVDTTQATETENVYKQADVDNIVSKVKGPLERKLAEATKQIDSLKQSALSEDEKRLEEAKKEGRAEAEKELAAFQKQAGIEKALLAKGVPGDMVARAAKLVDPETEDPAQAVEALAKEMPALFQNKTVGGGGGRNPDAPTPKDYSDPAQVDLILKDKSEQERMDWWREHGAEVEDAQRKRAGAVQTYAPGEGLGLQPTVESVRRKR
jgi:hypothetical protein